MPLGSKFGPLNFFKKLWLRQSLDIMVSYHHVQYDKKIMIQSSENLVTDKQTKNTLIHILCQSLTHQAKDLRIYECKKIARHHLF